ncbi:MAG: arylsulfatase A-like enzyme [Pirellulaceae bacterium]|jgi:arylsulfatase A-like enzyme
MPFRIVFTLLVSLLTSLTFAGQILSADRPNLIVIFTDDHGCSDLACQGIRNDLKTPHIDALAAGGVRMTSGYTSAPQCVPSRAGLLSGRYQNRIGVESNGQPLDGLNAEQTIAERLKKVRYATGMTRKWHDGKVA